MSPLELRVPGDKSIAHRAVLFGMLAEGESRVRNVPAAADVESTIGAARAFGARVERRGDEVVIDGRGIASLRAPAGPVDCGNSGTTARLCMGLAAALAGGTTTFDGDASLRRRPMERIAEPLRAAGAAIEYVDGHGTLPLRVTGGRPAPIRHRSEIPSAQVKSALLLCALAAGVDADIEEPVLSRDHTERMLASMGVPLRRAVDGTRVSLRGASAHALRPLDTEIPGDLSSAAFLIAGALLRGASVSIPSVGVNRTRTGFLDIVTRMGARVARESEREQGGEPVADLAVEPSPLHGIDVDGALVVRSIDELPLVAVLAAHARGSTTVAGAAELRAKESDRIRAVCTNLRAVGVAVEERPDGFVVHGGAAPLAGHVRSFGDHRIAMAFTVLGLRPGSSIDVDDLGVADVSFPGFRTQIERLRGGTATMGGAG